MGILRSMLLLLVLAVFCLGMTASLQENSRIYNLSEQAAESESFRNQFLDEESFESVALLSRESKIPMSKLLAAFFPVYRFDLRTTDGYKLTRKEYDLFDQGFREKNGTAYTRIRESLSAVWDDLVYYPVPDTTLSDEEQTSFENSWMAERTFGGVRGHEGCDLMPVKNKRECYPIISMTDGTVEQIGWLPQGGYRIGIRAPRGGYFYYAHLSSYASGMKKGKKIKAGELIGLMGDTGYSEVPGTTGNFDVHLHLGIYIHTANYKELSINPYWALYALKSHKLKYTYEV